MSLHVWRVGHANVVDMLNVLGELAVLGLFGYKHDLCVRRPYLVDMLFALGVIEMLGVFDVPTCLSFRAWLTCLTFLAG